MPTGELLLGVARLRAVWPALAAAMEPGRVRPAAAAGPIHLDPARQNRQHALDREARFQALRDGTVPSPPHADAAVSRILDARAAVDREVTSVAPEAYRAAYGRPIPARWWTPDPVDAGRAATIEARVPAALDAITAAAFLIRHAPLVASLADRLDRAAGQSERAVGLDAFWKPLWGIDCPACGRSTMRVRLDSPRQAEWVIECRYPTCFCSGASCGCARARRRRVPGRRHVWAPGEWPRLIDAVGGGATRLRDMLRALAKA